MTVAKEVVGFIFECGRDGPDYKVCRHLLGKLNGNIEMVAYPFTGRTAPILGRLARGLRQQ